MMDALTYFLSQFVNGVKLAVFMLWLPLVTMVYGILRLINFAHGDIMTVGVYTILVLTTAFGMPCGLLSSYPLLLLFCGLLQNALLIAP